MVGEDTLHGLTCHSAIEACHVQPILKCFGDGGEVMGAIRNEYLRGMQGRFRNRLKQSLDFIRPVFGWANNRDLVYRDGMDWHFLTLSMGKTHGETFGVFKVGLKAD